MTEPTQNTNGKCPRCGYPEVPIWGISSFDRDREIADWGDFQRVFPEYAKTIVPGQLVEIGEYVYKLPIRDKGRPRERTSNKIQRILKAILVTREGWNKKPAHYEDRGNRPKTLFDPTDPRGTRHQKRLQA